VVDGNLGRFVKSLQTPLRPCPYAGYTAPEWQAGSLGYASGKMVWPFSCPLQGAMLLRPFKQRKFFAMPLLKSLIRLLVLCAETLTGVLIHQTVCGNSRGSLSYWKADDSSETLGYKSEAVLFQGKHRFILPIAVCSEGNAE